MDDNKYLSKDNFGKVYEKYFPILVKITLKDSNYDFATAKDIVQDAMVKAFIKRNQFKGNEKNIFNWLYTITKNAKINSEVYRRVKKRDFRRIMENGENGENIEIPFLRTAEEILISKEKYERYKKFIKKSLKGCTPSEKVSIEGKFLLDLRCIEIARKYGLYETTPKRLVCLFKKKHSKSLAALLN